MAKRLPLIDKDGEVRELTRADFSRARPASQVLPDILGEELAGQMLKRPPGAVAHAAAVLSELQNGAPTFPTVVSQ